MHTKKLVDASHWYALLSILILPINSVINPLLYEDTIGRIFVKIFRMIWTETALQRRDQEIPAAREPRQPAPNVSLAREPRQPASNVSPDGSGETGQTAFSILLNAVKETGHATTPMLPDVDASTESISEANPPKLVETTV